MVEQMRVDAMRMPKAYKQYLNTIERTISWLSNSAGLFNWIHRISMKSLAAMSIFFESVRSSMIVFCTSGQ